jgi:uncharacterized LabA/DUF88 family protein
VEAPEDLPLVLGETSTAPVTSTPRSRGARRSARASAQPILTTSASEVDSQTIIGESEKGVELQVGESDRVSDGADQGPSATIPEQPTASSTPRSRPSRPSRSRQPVRLDVVSEAQPSATATPLTGQDELPTIDDPRRDPYDSWRTDGDTRETAPGGDLDSAEILARALLEMFPMVKAEPGAEESAVTIASEESPVEELAQLAELDATALDDDDQSGDEPSRRRGRRGRRGGRGRRRSASGTLVNGDEDLDDRPVAALEVLPVPGPSVADEEPRAPEIVPNSVEVQFSPGPRLQPERSWRDRGPQRRWNRTFPKDTQPVVMPPPKPSNGARFAAIPQAIAPRPQVAMSDAAVRSTSQFVMPDLRVGEPLAPGESRTERLLDVQNRLLQAMLEGQARQIDGLSATVANLRAAVNDIAANVGSRPFQPRTAIFVDAPNVCYAAENARVTLDFGRMLKYLTRDRHLVHALSYSPIIDDVREGIRYETQRFVAPFLRTGYKLITKPLKRFSDGSAKGNFDIELALDIITMADRLDVVVLVSGDSDFESVIQHIQSRGVRVEVVAFASNVSTELVNVADTFLDIGQHLEHFKAE